MTIRGYTLVEVLIGLMLFGFLFAGSYTAYREFISRQAIDRSIADLKKTVAEAKQYALSGEDPNNKCGNNSIVGYRIKIPYTPQFQILYSYTLEIVCSDGASYFVKFVSLQSGATYRLVGGTPTSVTFKTLGQGTDLTSNIQLNFIHSTYGGQRTVTITPAGVVQ